MSKKINNQEVELTQMVKSKENVQMEEPNKLKQITHYPLFQINQHNKPTLS